MSPELGEKHGVNIAVFEPKQTVCIFQTLGWHRTSSMVTRYVFLLNCIGVNFGWTVPLSISMSSKQPGTESVPVTVTLWMCEVWFKRKRCSRLSCSTQKSNVCVRPTSLLLFSHGRWTLTDFSQRLISSLWQWFFGDVSLVSSSKYKQTGFLHLAVMFLYLCLFL